MIFLSLQHIKDRQTLEFSYEATNRLYIIWKKNVVEFGRSKIEFAHLFKTDKIITFIFVDLEGVYLLDESPIKEPELGYVYLKKSIWNKEFFRVWEKYLVPTTIL